MSTIKVDTYQTRGGASEIAIDKLKGVTAAGSMLVVAEGGTTTTNLQQGLIKQFSTFDQRGGFVTQNTAGDTFNTSTQTDREAGTVVVNLTNNMNNTTYPAFNSPHYDRTDANRNYPNMGAGSNCTTSSYNACSSQSPGNTQDTVMNSALAGDLA